MENTYQPKDAHPISNLIEDANRRWQHYEEGRSKTFRETVAKYRERYGRHPPPGFKGWYIFARERNVHNIDDFEQIMDDLRPFWAIMPKTMRGMAARLQETDGVAGVHIRHKQVVKLTNPGWRSETLAGFIKRFVGYLPDMDIPVNLMDQPRIVIPYEDMQALLEVEEQSRRLPLTTKDQFTRGLGNMLDLSQETHDWGDDVTTDPQWFFYAGGHNYMDLVKLACPPGSPARNPEITTADAAKLYMTPLETFVSNFNLSTDLCTVGPSILDQHGFLYASSSTVASQHLFPVFSECKTNVNNDILFPANMYMLKDPRYIYDSTYDYDWEDKKDILVWRGVTSGGVQHSDDWQTMHRQRLVRLTNGTEMMTRGDVPILTQTVNQQYQTSHFNASSFAQEHFDVGLTDTWGCIPDCGFYDGIFSIKDPIPLNEQFKDKYLIDVDGHSFSGRWRAFLFSKSLGIKATIFREWHDSRLFAWRHFIPLDNQYNELYSLMTYFIGNGSPSLHDSKNEEDATYVPSHDFEAKMIATQAQTWAQHVLRDEDIEIYTLRLLLEYARLLDDNRDDIGYADDGSELDTFDRKYPMPKSLPSFSWTEVKMRMSGDGDGGGEKWS